jgi:hypothetical protein
VRPKLALLIPGLYIGGRYHLAQAFNHYFLAFPFNDTSIRDNRTTIGLKFLAS